ncbi:MAG: DUF4258 domain-containing protein [Gemmatimonadetes bacterium]|nr:DUF4258 domain-containing protein [Gemmatimonadota bacterium]
MSDPERVIPEDPLEFIRRCTRELKLLWTYHVQMRLRGRAISRTAILQAAESFEVIESYPEDKYLPSYLVYAHRGEDVFHVLFAADVAGDNVRVITAYRPKLSEWEPDLRTRRRKP